MIATSQAIRSFYSFEKGVPDGTPCAGTACFVASPDKPRSSSPLHCVGRCYAPPEIGGVTGIADRPFVSIDAHQPVVLCNVVHGGALDLHTYEQSGGYEALAKAMAGKPSEIIAEIERSELRGRGGAGFPAGWKWRAVANRAAGPRFVIANGDEGDPGAFIDRFLMEDDPFRILEAMTIAAFAVGAGKGFVYIRGEYPIAYERMANAISEARSSGLLGSHILGKSLTFDVELVRGLGSYVCGEQTAMIRAMEGKRPEVSARPPSCSEHGLFAQPTLVNNIETLANVPWIVVNGGDSYRQLGIPGSRGTKVLSLNSMFNRPGLYEVELGVTLRHVVEDLGKGLRHGPLKGLLLGGPLSEVITPTMLDLPIGFNELRDAGASLGHGGVIAFDDRLSIAALAEQVFSFAAFESCGKCTPCRLGSRRLAEIANELCARKASSDRIKEMETLCELLHQTSLCGLGRGVAAFGKSLLRHYREELERWAA